jgi:hypothetical protein
MSQNRHVNRRAFLAVICAAPAAAIAVMQTPKPQVARPFGMWHMTPEEITAAWNHFGHYDRAKFAARLQELEPIIGQYRHWGLG